MSFNCKNIDCTAPENKKGKMYPAGMDCPFCDEPLVEVISFSDDDLKLLDSLPYVIAYPLKETLLQNDYEKRLHRLGYTFINFLKYLGLISISEFFNSDLKNRRIVDLFLSQLREPSFGKWNSFIRECYDELHKEKVELIFPEFYDFYVQIETRDKKFNISEEIIEDFGELNYSKKNGLSSIGMLVHYRNKYLGHGTPINENKAKELWEFYYPIFQTLVLQLTKLSEASLYKRENGIVWKLASSVVTEEKNLNQKIDNDKVWLADKTGRKLSMVPFFIIPSDFGALKNEAQLLVYESYTGSTIKFFSPESIVKETSGEILQRLNLLLREKQKETPFTLEAFTKVDFLKRIVEENKLLLETLIKEKKIIPGIYQHREEMETKLREWIGARASIFFIAAEAGSGKTNLLVEIQKQYTERQLPSLLIRAGRMEKQTLKQQIAYLLNIDLGKGLENYTTIAGTQAEPTFILIDGLNEANNAEDIWQEVIELSKLFEPGSLKFVVTNRANSKNDLDRYSINEIDNVLLYGENKDNEIGLGAYAFWLAALDMKEMKGAWENYVTKDKAKFKPQFSFDDLATFDRAVYNQINNPLILRLFLEIYNRKMLPKKGSKHLHIWQDWLKTFSTEEQTFLKLLADEVWLKGANELLLDNLLKNENVKSYFISEIINSPYNRLKNNGWISSYVKDLNGYIGFTVEGALLYLLGVKLDKQMPTISVEFIGEIGNKGSKLQKSAVTFYLSELALRGDLSLISALIDEGNDKINICIAPLLIYLKTFGVKETITKLLENPTDNDWLALFKLDKRLADLQLHILRKEFLTEVMFHNQLLTKDAVLLGLKAIAIFDKSEALFYLNKIDPSAALIEGDADLLFQLGTCEEKFGNYDKALDFYQKCLDIRLKTLGVEHPSVATSYNNLGLVWRSKGETGKALDFYQKCLDIYLKTLGAEHPRLATSYNNIGLVWHSKGEYGKALEFHQKCLDIRLKTSGAEHPRVATSYNNIGGVWRSKGETDKALDFYQKCLDIRLKTLGAEHPDVATSYNNIGGVWESKGEYNEAITLFKKVFDIQKTGGPPFQIAECYESLNNTEKAFEYYLLSAEIRKERIGIDDEATQDAISNTKRLAKELNKENELPDWMK